MSQINNSLYSLPTIETQHCKEHYNHTAGWTVYSILHFLAFLFALYLAVKCNPKVSFGSILMAIFLPWIYIIYILISRRGFCGNVLDAATQGYHFW